MKLQFFVRNYYKYLKKQSYKKSQKCDLYYFLYICSLYEKNCRCCAEILITR